MNALNTDFFEKLLLHERKEVLERIEYLNGIILDPAESGGFHPGHNFGDMGTDTNEREKSFLLLSREEKYRKAIDRSLEAIHLGEYGVCRVCGELISVARLKAVPTTRICIRCKLKEKHQRM